MLGKNMRGFEVFRYGQRPLKVSFPNERVFEADNGSRFVTAQGRVSQGGSGIVFPARRLASGSGGGVDRLCALKFLKELTDVKRDRFANEVRLMEVLKHNHISGFYGSGIVELGEGEHVQVPWMAMDLGGDNLRRHVENRGPLPIQLVKRLGIQLCGALDHIHSLNIIHRDLKPANLVWADPDEFQDITMIDFGIAKYYGEDVSLRPMDQLTQHLEFVGPQFYSSPELIEYARDKLCPVDHRSDLFQLGLVLWFLATNRIIAGIPPKKHDPSGGGLHAIILDLLAMEPDDRPGSAAEVAVRLQAI